MVPKYFKVVEFSVRGHSTTTWTRRGEGGVNKKSTLVHPGRGVSGCPRGQKIEKKCIE